MNDRVERAISAKNFTIELSCEQSPVMSSWSAQLQTDMRTKFLADESVLIIDPHLIQSKIRSNNHLILRKKGDKHVRYSGR
ncbi:MAG: hypothetical protein D3910_22620 [Candidatus Electrothrix sp. ATG2]|nr:hypothetical protein [Candidatus Electrothrix sp. ATG2]